MRPSCIHCVLKHLGQAAVLMDEANLGYPSHRWLACGHLAEAEAEALDKFSELAIQIRVARIAYSLTDCVEPDMTVLIHDAMLLLETS